MTIQELRYLVALAEHRHFGRAAAACHVAQPSLSAGLKRLEEDLGARLFERSRRQVIPSQLGEQLVEQARVILFELERLEGMARSVRASLSGVFRLGTIPTVGPYLMPHVVEVLRTDHPELELHLVEQQTQELVAELRLGRLDAALLSPPLQEDGLTRVDLYREDFFLAAPVSHPLAQKESLRQREIRHEALLLLDEGHCLRDQILEICRTAASPARELLRGSSLETLRNMVAAGVGCTLLPALAVHPYGGVSALRENSPVRIVPFADPKPHRLISLYYRKGFSREESARDLSRWLKTHLPPSVSAKE
ncbi:MAG TPA: LysR substrate-binding domain-containing protein [Candidatus Krumholzibacteria bacterium]|nr:LysR substrate-binding domain-containing protein [Candidatus Krumholzibacteria bacterium]